MNQGDIQALRNPLLVLVVVLLAAAGAVYYTDSLRTAADTQLRQQQSQFREARTRLQKSGEEKEVIVRYLDRYRQLQQAGFLGEEQRINWLDGLRLANQQADLFGVDYQIGTQGPYPHAADLNPGQMVLSRSRMQVRFQLLHEEDLMRFLTALRQRGGGIFSIDRCSMRRIDTRGVIRYQPNINAECELSWITAKVGADASRSR